MLLPIKRLIHGLFENEPWLPSCITFIPTPAIPIPIMIVNMIWSHPGMSKVKIRKYGLRKSVNITMVFTQSFQFPVLLILFSLK